MRCARCETDNREGRRFCAECGAALAVGCPACGFANEPGEKFCGGCGQRLAAPAAAAAPSAPAPAASPTPSLASATPGAYTPRHLAERILTSRTALEGERKQVTVLFADLKGSMELLGNRDPEDARRLLDAVLERMMEAVHRFEGTVNQVMGDGIMALFGAPLALEAHAVRACHAALAMQDALQRYARQQAPGDPPVNIRIGLNSGEVVVRAIGSDLHMDYSAVGPTVHLAARMEQMAAPGTTLIAAETRRLAEGYVHVRPLGPAAVKGLSEPVDVFELLGSDAMRTRLQVSAARGLTPFVGRGAELEALPRALAHAAEGHGQVVALIGEAGVGKSRLIWEFTRSSATAGWLVLECRSVSYGKATTYLPVIDMMKTYFDVRDDDDAGAVRGKVGAKLQALDPALEPLRSPLLALLDVPVEDPAWSSLDPTRRRQHTLDAARHILMRQSEAQPLVLVFEDLHWIDSETQALLDGLVAHLRSSRILLLVNYRPEFQHTWQTHRHYQQLRMEPLVSRKADELLCALVGDGDALAPLRAHLIERTQGNPFFLEESVRALVETGVLAGERARYRLAKPLESVQIPGTVQAILAARIDRLAADHKRLLQLASVVGRDVPLALLASVAELSEADVIDSLAALQAGQFLRETTGAPEAEYTFMHALTHDVAYASLLHERRRTLHGRMVDEIERRYAGRLGEQVEVLARHAVRAEQWERALVYARQAGAKALARSAHPEAVIAFEQALAVLGRLPSTPERLAEAIDLRFDLRNSLWPLGRLQQLEAHLRQAEALADSVGDRRRLGQVAAYMSQFLGWMGDHDRAVDASRRTLQAAGELGDLALEVVGHFRLAQAHHARGEYRGACEVLRRILVALPGERERQRLGFTGLPSVLCRAWLSWGSAELGDFEEGRARGAEAMAIAGAGDHHFDLVAACFSASVVDLRQGQPERAMPVLERALHLCERHVPFWFPLIAACLGLACAQAGSTDRALPLLREAVKQHADMRILGGHALYLAWEGEGQLLGEHLDGARASAQAALALAQQHGERGHEAWARWLLAEIAARTGQDAAAECTYREAIALADALGMRPVLGRCHLGLGRVYARLGRRAAAGQALEAAVDALRALDMRLWRAHAETALATLQ